MSPPGGSRTTSWQMPFGATSAAHTLALNAQRHFHRYGTTRETLGWIALNQRANAALNPTAIYRDPMTMDDYLSARMITTPFGLYDCDVPCDGAVAVIVSAVDVARDMPKKPVLFEAVGTQIIERTRLGSDDDDPRTPGTRPGRPPVDPNVVAPQRRRRRRALRRVQLQLPVLARGTRLLRDRRGQGLPRRRPQHRARRRDPAQHARRSALARPNPRHGPRSTRPSPSCGARPASGRSKAPASRSSAAAASPPAARS